MSQFIKLTLSPKDESKLSYTCFSCVYKAVQPNRRKKLQFSLEIKGSCEPTRDQEMLTRNAILRYIYIYIKLNVRTFDEGQKRKKQYITFIRSSQKKKKEEQVLNLIPARVSKLMLDIWQKERYNFIILTKIYGKTRLNYVSLLNESTRRAIR